MIIEPVYLIRLRDKDNNTWYIQPKHLDFLRVDPSGFCDVNFTPSDGLPLHFEIDADDTVKLVNKLQDYYKEYIDAISNETEDNHLPKETKNEDVEG